MTAGGALPLALAGSAAGFSVWFAAHPAVLALGRSWLARLRVRGAALGRALLDGSLPLASRGPRALFARMGAGSRSRSLRAEERARCLDELSELIDVVALGLAAGVSFDASLQIYCSRYKTALADLMGDAMRSWRLGLSTRREALGSLARELDVPAFTMFADTVCESLEFGAPLASALVSQAEAVRAARRSAVQENIEKAPVKMLVPTGTLVLPAMLLAILGPLLASLADLGF